MKKPGNILRMIMIIMVLTVYTNIVSLADEAKFIRGTTVNGVNVAGLTVEVAKAKMEEFYARDYKLEVVTKEGASQYLSGKDIGYRVNIPDKLSQILDTQNSTGRHYGPALVNKFTIEVTGAYDEGALEAQIQALPCVGGTDIKKTVNAHISEYKENQAFTIIPETYGNSVDVEKVTALVKSSLSVGQVMINLSDAGCYQEVTVTSEDESLQKLCNVMNQYKDMVITYTFGEGVTEELSGSVIVTWLTGIQEGQIVADRERAAAYVKALADKYDTVHTTRSFRTHGGNQVPLTGPYGWKMNQEAETDALIGMVLTGKSQTREPEYSKRAASRTLGDWGNTYVEIDLTGQHVYMYQNGIMVWDAPCVTGNVSKQYTTPSGIYSLTYKEKDRVLRGKKLKDGTYEYESPVKYWMPFHGGFGFHDASWRSKFGGTIYQKSGSHGCINLPPAKAKVLYELVYSGIPVISY